MRWIPVILGFDAEDWLGCVCACVKGRIDVVSGRGYYLSFFLLSWSKMMDRPEHLFFQ